jgi:tyrosyl-tRNA synthetase
MDAPVMTYQPKSDFLRVMIERGFLADCTDYAGPRRGADRGRRAGYIGFDATAKSLHVGSLIQIMMLRWLQKTGHKPITLMGGGTTKVGDPSFRDDERPLLTAATSTRTSRASRRSSRATSTTATARRRADAQQCRMARRSELPRFPARYRAAFLGQPDAVLRSVKSRLDREQSLSFLEFNYMILQAYDFLELNRRYGCRCRWAARTSGATSSTAIDLTRRVLDAEIFGLTSPLLTTSDGKKMGKIRLGRDLAQRRHAEPYEFWQFWRNTTDADVGRFLKLYTELPVDECDRLGALGGSEINEAKIVLANEVTALCHGARPPSRRGHRARGLREGRRRRGPAHALAQRGGGRRRHFRRAAHHPLRPRQIRQGGQAPDRRWRRADERCGDHRCGPDAGPGRHGRTHQAQRGEKTPRARRAGALIPFIFPQIPPGERRRRGGGAP